MLTKNDIKISMFWLLIGIGYILHSLYHVSDIFYGIDVKLPTATGEVPLYMHLIRVFLGLTPFVMVLLPFYNKNKGGLWFNFGLAILFLLSNISHLGEMLFKDIENISQIGLLSYILIINILLTVVSWKVIKE